jgi:uncharacterized membrane protein
VEIADTITIDAPVERVWELTLDVEALPSITPTVTSVERLDDGPVQIGSRTRLAQPGLPRRVWTIEELDAPFRFAWATRLLGVRMVGIHELASAGEDRCELTLRVRLEGRGAGLLESLGGRSMARALAAENAGFARAAVATPA